MGTKSRPQRPTGSRRPGRSLLAERPRAAIDTTAPEHLGRGWFLDLQLLRYRAVDAVLLPDCRVGAPCWGVSGVDTGHSNPEFVVLRLGSFPYCCGPESDFRRHA